MKSSLRVYIGHDRREQDAYAVAERTARQYGCETYPVIEERLRLSGMLHRPTDSRGQLYDLNSSAHQSTDFAVARFAVPLLAHSGWCLFVDCDVVFLENPNDLMLVADRSKAVHVVKHSPVSCPDTKMDGQKQSYYHRKLWSSVCLWNCDHPANRRLNLTTLNQWPGRMLHAFEWLSDDEIGELDPSWNWLVGVQPKPERPRIAHFTLGVPSMPGVESEHADIWWRAHES